ncbi:unnamed protein product, partial [Didymodactylos carnosus]
MAKVLTTAKVCAPNLLLLTKNPSSTRSSNRSYTIQQSCPRTTGHSLITQQQLHILTRNHNPFVNSNNFTLNPVLILFRGNAQQPKGFLSKLMDDIQEEFSKNKDIKDNIKKFREQAKKLEDSTALKEARDKYKTLERETMKSSTVIREKIDQITEKVKDSDVMKKASELGQEMGKQAQKAAGKISETTEQITDTVTFKKVSERLSTIKEEVGDATKLTRPLGYCPPKVLRKRSETDLLKTEKIFDANT